MSYFMLPSLINASPMDTMSSFMLAQQANTLAMQSIWCKNAYMSTMPLDTFCNCSFPAFPGYLDPKACVASIMQQGFMPNINWNQFFSNSIGKPGSTSNQTPDSAVVKQEDSTEVRKQKKELESSVNLAKKLKDSNNITRDAKIALETALDNYDKEETLEEKNECLKEAINEVPENVIKDIVASSSSEFITVYGTNIGEYLKEIGSFDINDSSNKSMRDAVNSSRESLKNLTQVNTLSDGGAALLGKTNTLAHADQVLNIISLWNTERGSNGDGGFIESLYAKYTSGKLDDSDKFWNEAIVPYITALTDKAESICELVNDDALKAKINNAKDNLLACDEPGSRGLKKAFNELYVILRRSAAQVADEKLKEEYGYLEKEGGNFKTNVYSTMTNDDLRKEHFDDDFASTVSTVSTTVRETVASEYKKLVEAAYKSSSIINQSNRTDAKYIKVYHMNTRKKYGFFPDNGKVMSTLEQIKFKAIEEGMSPRTADLRYKLARNYLNNALNNALKYDKNRKGRNVSFNTNSTKSKTGTVVCSREDKNDFKELDKISKQFISGERASGISVCLSENRDHEDNLLVSVAINWAEIYHIFFEKC